MGRRDGNPVLVAGRYLRTAGIPAGAVVGETAPALDLLALLAGLVRRTMVATMRLYSTVTVDEYDHFEADVTDTDEPPEHGVVRLREFSIQGEASALRRLAAAILNAADLAERVDTP